MIKNILGKIQFTIIMRIVRKRQPEWVLMDRLAEKYLKSKIVMIMKIKSQKKKELF